MEHRSDIRGYVPNSSWQYSHHLGREFFICYRPQGAQSTKRNFVSLYETATESNEHYTTDDGRPVPKKVYRHLVQVWREMEGV